MSLVVARTYGKQIFVVSDTRLTDAHGKKIPATQGIIKSIIINQNVCLSFAGLIDYADNALKSFRQVDTSADPFNQTVQHFFEWHTRARKKTDFILAFGVPYHKIVAIKDGQFVETSNSWLGDDKAFERFQGYFHNGISSTPTPINTSAISFRYLPEPHDERTSNEYLRMLNAMIASIRTTTFNM